jgi:hypothetical protein
VPFDTGVRLAFQNSTAPTGWTKDTVNFNDHALRIVTGTVSSGGTVNFSTAFSSKAVSGSISSETAAGTISSETAGGTISAGGISGTTNGFTLSTTEMPSHSHYIASPGGGTAGAPDGSNYLDQTYFAPQSAYSYTLRGTSVGADRLLASYNGGSGSHSHSFSATHPTHTFAGTAHSHTFSGTAHSHTFSGTAIDMTVRYVDFIIATKD